MTSTQSAIDMLKGRTYLLKLPKEVALFAFSAFSRMEKTAQQAFRKFAGQEWFILRDIFGGVVEESAYTMLCVLFYPVGLINWDNGWLSTLANTQTKIYPKAKRHRPILLLHGYFHNNSAYLLLRDRLRKDGWGNVYSMNLKTHREDIPTMAKRVSNEVKKIMKKTRQDRIDLIGHSLGGLVARHYVQKMDGHRHVVNCITLGAPHKGTEVSILGFGKSAKQMSPRSAYLRDLNSDTGTLRKLWFTSIWSPFDIMVLPPENATIRDTSVKNVRVNFVGHYGLLFSDRVYKVIKHTLLKKEKKAALFSLLPFQSKEAFSLGLSPQ